MNISFIIPIVHGDQEAIAADNCDGVQQRASLRREIAFWYEALTTDGSQGPPEAIYGEGV